MTASSVTGTGLGTAGPKAEPIGNVENVLFVSSANNNETVTDNIEAIFINFDNSFTLNLPLPKTKVGRTITLRNGSSTNGHTLTLNAVYDNSNWTFSSNHTTAVLMSDEIGRAHV